MEYLTIGQWFIPITWLAFLSAIIYIDYCVKKQKSELSSHVDRILLLYVLLWKGSYIVVQFQSFQRAPLSLLYFDGGIVGHITAMIAVIGYVIWKRLDLHFILHTLARFIAVFSIVNYMLNTNWIVAVVYVIILIWIERSYSYWILVVQWLLIVAVEGWQSYFVVTIGLVVVIQLLQTKTVKLAAAIYIASLVGTMLIFTQNETNLLAREPIQLETTTGEEYYIEEQQEAIVVVNFFATWCPPCNAEMPHLIKFNKELPKDVQLIGINLSARDNGKEALSNFMDKHNVNYPILLDHHDKYGDTYNIVSIPTTIILKNGQEATRIVGPVSDEQLRKIVSKLQ